MASGQGIEFLQFLGGRMEPLFQNDAGQPWTDLGNGVRRRVRLHLPNLMMVEFAFIKGGVGPLHSHPHLQCSFVAKGAFNVTISGETHRLDQGGSYIVPANAVHGVVALEDGLLVDVFTPRREEFLAG
jgi:quercetin dioxygenase-like cupin family protein